MTIEEVRAAVEGIRAAKGNEQKHVNEDSLYFLVLEAIRDGAPDAAALAAEALRSLEIDYDRWYA